MAPVPPPAPFMQRATKLLISCDVGPGNHMRLEAVADRIETLAGSSWRYMDTCWLFLTEMRATHVRDALRSHLQPDDRLLVALIANHAAWHGFEPSAEDWLLANL